MNVLYDQMTVVPHQMTVLHDQMTVSYDQMTVLNDQTTANRYASLQISAEAENFGGNVGIQLQLEFKDVPRMDFFGQADPFYKVRHPLNPETSTLNPKACILNAASLHSFGLFTL